jgi:hypothetical protein
MPDSRVERDLTCSVSEAVTRGLAAAAHAHLSVHSERPDGFIAGNQWFGLKGYEIEVTAQATATGCHVTVDGRTMKLTVGGWLDDACTDFVNFMADPQGTTITPQPDVAQPLPSGTNDGRWEREPREPREPSSSGESRTLANEPPEMPSASDVHAIVSLQQFPEWVPKNYESQRDYLVSLEAYWPKDGEIGRAFKDAEGYLYEIWHPGKN